MFSVSYGGCWAVRTVPLAEFAVFGILLIERPWLLLCHLPPRRLLCMVGWDPSASLATVAPAAVMSPVALCRRFFLYSVVLAGHLSFPDYFLHPGSENIDRRKSYGYKQFFGFACSSDSWLNGLYTLKVFLCDTLPFICGNQVCLCCTVPFTLLSLTRSKPPKQVGKVDRK